MHGILVLVWISGWMVVLRLLASHFVERLAPTGMLLTAAVLTGTGLFLLSLRAGAVVGARRGDASSRGAWRSSSRRWWGW